MTKAVLLDFDGTIINSQPAINGYLFSLLERKGVSLTQAEKESLGGISLEHILTWLEHEKNLHITPVEMLFHKAYFWLFRFHEIRPFPGAIKLLEKLKQQDIKMAIVTNSPRAYTIQLLRKNHLTHYFDTIVSVDDAGVAKPDPKMLGMAATRLGVSYKDCLLIDDNEPGILAAKALGIKSIQLKEEKGKGKKLADITLPKIEQAIPLIHQ
ncbi:MAG: HAD family phosphatase [Nanoarchaeota archaeon]|nr:HAD family phosphatase [Nanoarchaeota archaeon]